MKCGRCLGGHMLRIGQVESTEEGKKDDLYWCRHCGTLVHWSIVEGKFIPVLERVPHDAREKHTGGIKLVPIDVPVSCKEPDQWRVGE